MTGRRRPKARKRLLSEYEQPPLDAAIDEQLTDFVARRTIELG